MPKFHESSASFRAVTVEYDERGGRARKTFEGPSAVGASRKFYLRKANEGKAPKIVSAAR